MTKSFFFTLINSRQKYEHLFFATEHLFINKSKKKKFIHIGAETTFVQKQIKIIAVTITKKNKQLRGEK